MATRSKQAKIRRIEQRIVSIDEASPYLKILLYGRSKKGKTRTAATAPKPLIIDVNEKGTRSARKIAPHAKVLQVTKWEDFVYAYWLLKGGKHDFESVVIDNWTQVQNICMRQVLKDEEDRDPNRDPSMPDRRAYGKVKELIVPQILNFRNLPLHVIYIAQERTITDDDGEVLEVVPEMSGANRGVLLASVDVIGRIYQKEVRTGDPDAKTKKGKGKETKTWETRMLVGPHDLYETGDRTGSLGRIMRNPSIPKILKAADLNGHEEEE